MHEPVLVQEVVHLLNVKRGGVCIDGTVGSGGHTVALLEAIGPGGRLLGIDRDEDAIVRTRQRVADAPQFKGGRASFETVCGNFADIRALAVRAGFRSADGVLLDLGASSEQLDTPERGFSFMHEGPLDMRMNGTEGVTAADLVNSLDRDALAALISDHGQERYARRIAASIVGARAAKPVRTTRELAELIEGTVGRRGRIHPATRTFMALRMAVNREIESLEEGLAGALDLLSEGGRLAVISFHSIEDRIVKRFFREHAGRWESLAAGGREWRGAEPRVRLVNRRPAVPAEGERQRNARARSAKLRVAERIFRRGMSGARQEE